VADTSPVAAVRVVRAGPLRRLLGLLAGVWADPAQFREALRHRFRRPS
jgi:hypothetical protein